jgi:hypothetical protein
MAGRQVNSLLMICSSEGRSFPQGTSHTGWDIGFRACAGLPLGGEETRTIGSHRRQIVAAIDVMSAKSTQKNS